MYSLIQVSVKIDCYNFGIVKKRITVGKVTIRLRNSDVC